MVHVQPPTTAEELPIPQVRELFNNTLPETSAADTIYSGNRSSNHNTPIQVIEPVIGLTAEEQQS